MQAISMGAEVVCRDGLCGKSTQIIADLITTQSTYLVVGNNGMERIVPVKFVTESSANQIKLSCTRDEFASFQLFVGTDYVNIERPQPLAQGTCFPT